MKIWLKKIFEKKEKEGKIVVCTLTHRERLELIDKCHAVVARG